MKKKKHKDELSRSSHFSATHPQSLIACRTLSISSCRSLIYRLVKYLAMSAPFMMKYHLAWERSQDVEDEGEAVLVWLAAVCRTEPAPLRV